MQLMESVEIRADSSRIWSFVGDVSQWPFFVSKIIKTTHKGGNSYEFQHIKGPIQAEVLDGKVEKEIAVKLMIGRKGAIVRYVVEEIGPICRVREIQEFPIPFPVNLLIKWLHKSGKKIGVSNLENLKKVVETSF